MLAFLWYHRIKINSRFLTNLGEFDKMDNKDKAASG